MSVRRAAAVVLLLLWTTAEGKDAVVSCVLGQSCVLPCTFQSGDNLLIHWYKELNEDIVIHSFYKNRTQLSYQHRNYTNRTALSEEIRFGNASLLLRKINVYDEGRYKCYISLTDQQEFYVNLRVHAPVLEVSLRLEEEQLLCRAENIYPEPSVNWTFSPGPPTDPQTSTESSQSGLFSVNSSVPLTQRPPLEYSCNISTEHSWRSATYRINTPINCTGSEVIIGCAPDSSSALKSLIWTFNWTQTIVTQTGSEPVYNETWERSVEVLESGDLRWKDLSALRIGVYCCLLQTDTRSFISHTELEGGAQRIVQSGDHTIWITVGCIVGGLLLVAIIGSAVMFKNRQTIQERCSNLCNNDAPPPRPPEQFPLRPQ